MNDPTQDTTAVIETEHRTEPEGVRIRERLARMDGDTERFFRINTGRGFVSNKVRRQGRFTILQDARMLQAGPDGWFDVCGWTSVKITPEMVGTTVAVFTGLEFKRNAQDKPNDDQQRLGECLERMGGIWKVILP